MGIGRVGFGIVLVVAIGAGGCLDATEITVEVTTDVRCEDFGGAAITVGKLGDLESRPPASVATTCDANGHVGALVVVPTASKDEELGIRVVAGLGKSAEQCGP